MIRVECYIDYDAGILIHDWNLHILVIRFGADSLMQLCSHRTRARSPKLPNWRVQQLQEEKAMGTVEDVYLKTKVGNRN